MHRVYMRFLREPDLTWRVSFVCMAQELPMREFRFTEFAKVEQLAERAGALRDLACKQGLETGQDKGKGGILLNLSDEQFQRVTR